MKNEKTYIPLQAETARTGKINGMSYYLCSGCGAQKIGNWYQGKMCQACREIDTLIIQVAKQNSTGRIEEDL